MAPSLSRTLMVPRLRRPPPLPPNPPAAQSRAHSFRHALTSTPRVTRPTAVQRSYWLFGAVRRKRSRARCGDPTRCRHRGTGDGAAGGGVAAVRCPALGRAGAGAAGAVGGGVAARHVAPGLRPPPAASHEPPGSPEVSVCFANRSAALFHLRCFEVCLEDIARAESHGYPDRLLPKVLLRKAECLLCLGRLQDAADALSVVENKIAMDGIMTSPTHQTVLKKLSQLKIKIHEKESCPEPAQETCGDIQRKSENWEENDSISGASSSLSLNFDTERGRHLVASQDILPGQSLLKEEAFVSVLCPGESHLLQDSSETVWDTRVTNADLYCHRCLRQLLASVPCRGCSYAKYCSQSCADMAWEQYHRTECSLGALLLTLGVFCHVALRTVLLAGFAEVSRLVKRSHDDDKDLHNPEARCKHLGEAPDTRAGTRSIPGCNDNGQYQSSYQAVFNLLPHAEKHSPEHKFLCMLSVVAICKQLQEAGLEAAVLNQESSEKWSKPKTCEKTWGELSPELKTMAEAMLRHMLQLQCNAQAITVMQESGSGDSAVVNKKPMRLATAFFPVLSLLNHSCCPNISVSFSGTAATVRASQPIPSGQEIFHCYGPHRCRMRVAERQQLLSQYFFKCRCQACLDELESDVKSVVSMRNSFCCPSCRAPVQGEEMLCCSNEACAISVSRESLSRRLRDLQQQIKKALELLRDRKADQAIKMLLKCQMDAGNFLSPGHLLMGEMEDHLAQVYATLDLRFLKL
ncbi:SET and MYND domain-containing protein 4 isoform X3 [Harpia harpyja]|uniref:SET and MYND domain-containing protein 4 isoform X3 n=1 Tax=Harpia harpyja TaxID=202280 RepID=UPI0022B11059|nr:SET and MYND domain-containing protein 4 isoform X3 [Harpia harpyja]